MWYSQQGVSLAALMFLIVLWDSDRGTEGTGVVDLKDWWQVTQSLLSL